MLVEVCKETFGKPLGLLHKGRALHAEAGLDIRGEQPRTGGTLMVCEVPVELRAFIYSLVLHISRREGADTSCGNELGVYYLQNQRMKLILDG